MSWKLRAGSLVMRGRMADALQPVNAPCFVIASAAKQSRASAQTALDCRVASGSSQGRERIFLHVPGYAPRWWMSDKHTTLPAFTPVPRTKDRSNGWKPAVQRQFIEALAELGSVKAACRRIGRADHGAYLLRRHPEAEEFRRAWDAALDIGMRRIEDVAMERAL